MIGFQTSWRQSVLVVLAAGAALVSESRAHADAPALVPVQGYLTASDGTPIEGDHSLAFGVHAVATGGSALYQETRTVSIVAGDFVVYLGEVTPLPLTLFRDQEDLWLEVVIDGTDVVTPRIRFGAGPYAGLAQYCSEASTLEGNDASDFALVTHTHAFTSLTSVPAGLADGDDDTLGALSCTANQIPKRSGGVWTCGADDDSDTLGGLSCTTGQFVQRGASAFACATPATVATSGSYTDLINAPAGLLTGAGTTNYLPVYTGATTLAASTVFQGALGIGVGTTSPNVRLDINGEIAWGVTATRPNRLGSAEGGSIELGDPSVVASKPFIDFHYGNSMSQDYNVRVSNEAEGELRVRAGVLRVQGLAAAANIVMGHSSNSIAAGAASAAIGGGGDASAGNANSVTDSAGTVGGGLGNRAGNASGTTDDAQSATVGGGHQNVASGSYATVGGGRTQLASGTYSTIAGGNANTADDLCFIGGGSGNSIDGGSSVIGGGSSNTATDTWSSVIAGGSTNTVDIFYYSVIGGGSNNSATEAYYSVIAGGTDNLLSGSASYAVISGGIDNSITDSNAYGVIAGGSGNTASGYYTTVSGGSSNNASGFGSTVPGGASNVASGDYSVAAGNRAKATANGCFAWGDSTAADVTCNTTNAWVARASGGVTFYTSSTLAAGVTVAAGAGTWASVSDRAAKRDIESVSGAEVLEAVERMPIATWRYITETSGARHMGPMAQDFKAAFGLGDSDKSITTVDADGVALAAVQGLGARTKQHASAFASLEREQATLRADVRALRAQNAALQTRLQRLEARAGGNGAGTYSWLGSVSTLLVGVALVLGYRKRGRAA